MTLCSGLLCVCLFVPGVWWIGVDPGGLHPSGPRKSSGLGHVCVPFLLPYHHSLVLHIYYWHKPKQHLAWLGKKHNFMFFEDNYDNNIEFSEVPQYYHPVPPQNFFVQSLVSQTNINSNVDPDILIVY